MNSELEQRPVLPDSTRKEVAYPVNARSRVLIWCVLFVAILQLVALALSRNHASVENAEVDSMSAQLAQQAAKLNSEISARKLTASCLKDVENSLSHYSGKGMEANGRQQQRDTRAINAELAEISRILSSSPCAGAISGQ
jgi:hypothetical protein